MQLPFVFRGDVFMQKKYLWIYLIWVYGAAWLMWSIAIVVGTNSYLYHVNTVVAMLAPTYAFFLTQKISGNKISLSADFKFGLKKNWRYYIIAWLLPGMLTFLGAVVYFAVLPNELDMSFGYVSKALKDNHINNVTAEYYITQEIVSGVTVAPFINMILGMGEEIGWRGYLYPELSKKYSPLKAHLLMGFIWGFWHTPINMTGYNYGLKYFGYPVVGIIAMSVFCFSAGVMLSWLTEKTGSIFPASLMHGSINAINSAGVMFQGMSYLYGPTMILGPSPNGFIGGIPMLILALVIILKSEKKFQKKA